MIEELWKDIDGYEGSYKISNIGRVRSVERYVINNINNGQRLIKSRILKPRIHTGGYLRVQLKGKDKYIHRLVSKAFIYNPDNKPQVNHIDCDKTNNRVDNLEWVTGKENTNHAIQNGLWDNKQNGPKPKRS